MWPAAARTGQADDGVAQRGELHDAHDLLHEVVLDLAVHGAREAQEGAVDEGLVDGRLRQQDGFVTLRDMSMVPNYGAVQSQSCPRARHPPLRDTLEP